MVQLGFYHPVATQPESHSVAQLDDSGLSQHYAGLSTQSASASSSTSASSPSSFRTPCLDLEPDFLRLPETCSGKRINAPHCLSDGETLLFEQVLADPQQGMSQRHPQLPQDTPMQPNGASFFAMHANEMSVRRVAMATPRSDHVGQSRKSQLDTSMPSSSYESMSSYTHDNSAFHAQAEQVLQSLRALELDFRQNIQSLAQVSSMPATLWKVLSLQVELANKTVSAAEERKVLFEHVKALESTLADERKALYERIETLEQTFIQTITAVEIRSVDRIRSIHGDILAEAPTSADRQLQPDAAVFAQIQTAVHQALSEQSIPRLVKPRSRPKKPVASAKAATAETNASNGVSASTARKRKKQGPPESEPNDAQKPHDLAYSSEQIPDRSHVHAGFGDANCEAATGIA
ncbi:hypothetical protein BCV70DRAFT_197736 [Testicularia cyperi]|uniref:Uncharacterized protein n=1 Tax=Testicularia cyperi TaxID=1882483 RepID=A0A317XZ03_9BASI|nr:hypothetical protein BCV70DRAFT_197736 [Testicularia cyperi]